MNVEAYLEMKARLRREELSRGRNLCFTCLQPPYGCYCRDVRPFDPKIDFIVLIHPLEARRRIATGRMSHLCLTGSRLFRGEDFSDSAAIDGIVADPRRACAVLYPGPDALDLGAIGESDRAAIAPAEKRLTIFVLDGTWWTARKMVRSANLKRLPKIAFTPRRPSRFRIRKQPSRDCLSTIEAIHWTIELLGPSRGFDSGSRAHDELLRTFDGMVERQLHCINKIGSNRHSAASRSR